MQQVSHAVWGRLRLHGTSSHSVIVIIRVAVPIHSILYYYKTYLIVKIIRPAIVTITVYHKKKSMWV